MVALRQHLIAGAANANELLADLFHVLTISRKREGCRRDKE
jgi:hypothetical protein